MNKIPYIGGGGIPPGHLLGGVNTTYQNIVDKLGEPNQEGDDYKTDAEWLVMTEKGHATIYNYKTGINYNGEENGIPTEDITDWHIGGDNPEVVDIVINYLIK